MTMKQLERESPDNLMPREKAMAFGIKTLSDAELMALIFATGIKGKNVVRMCEDILVDNEYHISKVARMNVKEFMNRYKGIGPAKALTMLAALELGNRSAADALKVEQTQIRTSEQAYRYMKPHLDGLDHEEFWVLYLKRNNAPIRAMKIGQGGLSTTIVDIKIIMREALSANAASMMLFHNHPSGNIHPSEADITLTKRIGEAAKLFEMRVLDHLIIGLDNYYSFYESQLI